MTKHSFIARKNAFIRYRGDFPARVIAKVKARTASLSETKLIASRCTRAQKSQIKHAHQSKGRIPRRALCRRRGEQTPRRDDCADVTITNILRHPRTNWDWRKLSCSPHITLNTIRAHSHLPWVWFIFCAENPNVCIKDILDNADGIFTLSRMRRRKIHDWDFGSLIINPSIKIADMIANPQFPWNFNNISQNDSVTMADIFAYPHLPWDFDELSHSHNISASDMISHPQFPWDYMAMPNKADFVFERALPILQNRMHFLLRFFSNHHAVTMDDIENHLELPWNWTLITVNPNITPEFLEKHMDKLSIKHIHQNDLDMGDRAFVIEAKKEANKRAISLRQALRGCVGDCVAKAIARYIDFE